MPTFRNSAGTGWGIFISQVGYLGKYQIEMLTNQGPGHGHSRVSAYRVEPGTFHRALFVCDEAGTGTWYVNGVASTPQTCVAPVSGATDLFIGRYPDPGAVCGFPISGVQIRHRALTASEALLSTTTDPGPAVGGGTIAFNGTVASPVSWSPTQIVVPGPSGATTGPIVVTAGGQASNGVTFTVLTTPPPRRRRHLRRLLLRHRRRLRGRAIYGLTELNRWRVQ